MSHVLPKEHSHWGTGGGHNVDGRKLRHLGSGTRERLESWYRKQAQDQSDWPKKFEEKMKM